MTTTAPEPPIIVSVAPRADSRVWKQRQTDWPGYLEEIHLTNPFDHKECGGILPAALRNTERTNAEVVARYVATLDADYADLDFPAHVATLLPGIRLAWHTTWRHTPADPRYRFHVPFSREVTPAEYSSIVRALVRYLGEQSFDLNASRQPAQFSWLASTPDPSLYEYGLSDGDLLDPDHWLNDDTADLASSNLALSLETDDDPPTPQQIDKALSILRKYEQEVSSLQDKRTGATLDGRNAALISRLPTLYRFVLAGCLPDDLVYDSLWAAVQQAPGDHDFTEREYRTVTARARQYALNDGPGKPTATADFQPLPTAPLADLDDRLNDASIAPNTQTQWMLPNNGGVAVAALGRHLINAFGLGATEGGREAKERLLCSYSKGVWREDGKLLIESATNRIFGDSLRKAKTENVLTFIQSYPGLPIVPIDTPHPSLINLTNGMYDIHTGLLEPHDPLYFSRMQIPHAYDPDATCPNFDKWLAEVLRPDQISVMWEVIGYALYPQNPLHRAVLLHGAKGRNGKSTLLKILSALVGPENHTNIPLGVLAAKGDNFAIADLRGRLVNIAGEQDSGQLQTSTLKQLISGDPISANRKGIARVTFIPHAMQIIATNNSITAKDDSDAMVDRFVIFEFEKSFYGREDPFLEQRLTISDELQGILAHALRALATLLARKAFDLTPMMIADRAEYGAAMGGTVKEFAHSYLTADPDNEIKGDALLTAYQNACMLDNVKQPLGRNKFYRALLGDSRITRIDKGDEVVWFKGVRLVGDPSGAQADFL